MTTSSMELPNDPYLHAALAYLRSEEISGSGLAIMHFIPLIPLNRFPLVSD